MTELKINANKALWDWLGFSTKQSGLGLFGGRGPLRSFADGPENVWESRAEKLAQDSHSDIALPISAGAAIAETLLANEHSTPPSIQPMGRLDTYKAAFGILKPTMTQLATPFIDTGKIAVEVMPWMIGAGALRAGFGALSVSGQLITSNTVIGSLNGALGSLAASDYHAPYGDVKFNDVVIGAGVGAVFGGLFGPASRYMPAFMQNNLVSNLGANYLSQMATKIYDPNSKFSVPSLVGSMVAGGLSTPISRFGTNVLNEAAHLSRGGVPMSLANQLGISFFNTSIGATIEMPVSTFTTYQLQKSGL